MKSNFSSYFIPIIFSEMEEEAAKEADNGSHSWKALGKHLQENDSKFDKFRFVIIFICIVSNLEVQRW